MEEELCNVSKMRTYKSYKSELVMESYLLLPLHLRTALLRFRISCHQLKMNKTLCKGLKAYYRHFLDKGLVTTCTWIEIGRYLRPPLPAQERMCLFCNDGSIEDEKHFMLSCTLYSNMPAYIVFLDTCKETIHNFQYLSTESKFNHVMRSTDHKLIYHLVN